MSKRISMHVAACCAALAMGAGSAAQAAPWSPSGGPFADRIQEILDRIDEGQDCPVGLVNGLSLDDEFGPGTDGLTRCLQQRHNVKVVMQVNRFCRDSVPNDQCAGNRAYALGNMRNMIKDYETTHGMVAGEDFEIVAVVHSGGGWLMLKDEGTDGSGSPVSGRNQFEGQVKELIAKGVEFYFCQNTTRSFIGKDILPDATESTGGATGELIEGVKYTTAGVTAIAELQSLGYTYVQP